MYGDDVLETPAAAALATFLSEELCETEIRLQDLITNLVRHGHRRVGAKVSDNLSSDEHEEYARKLLKAYLDILLSDPEFDILAGRNLLYVSETRWLESGACRIDANALIGVRSHSVSYEIPKGVDLGLLPARGHLFVSAPEEVSVARLPGIAVNEHTIKLASLRSLEPLVRFNANRAEVYFFNGLEPPDTLKYLSYLEGERCYARGNDEWPTFLSRLAGVDPPKRSLVDPPPPPPPLRRSPEQPLTLGDFRLGPEIGRGGMARVFRAYQASLDRAVAVKHLNRSNDPKATKRFRREISALGQVDHPNLVKVFVSEVDQEDRLFYAMELVEGSDLERFRAKLADCPTDSVDATWSEALGAACNETACRAETVCDEAETSPLPPLEVGEDDSAATTSHTSKIVESQVKQLASEPRAYNRWVAEMIRQVACAAHSLHEAKIVHRDIKPSNVMVTADRKRAILMDLGLAQLDDEVAGHLTETREFVGTYRYASPQQLLCARDTDARNDIYSLGATLWELLSLHPIYEFEEGATDLTLQMRIIGEPPERIRKFRPEVPDDLEAIALKCLERNPDDRYPNAMELARDLNRWLDGELVQARSHTIGYVLRKHVARHYFRYLAATSAVLLVITAVVFAFFWLNWTRIEVTNAHRQAHAIVHDLVGKVGDLAPSQRRGFLKEAEDYYLDLWPARLHLADFVKENHKAYAEVCMILGEMDWKAGTYEDADRRFDQAQEVWGNLRKALEEGGVDSLEGRKELMLAASRQLDTLAFIASVRLSRIMNGEVSADAPGLRSVLNRTNDILGRLDDLDIRNTTVVIYDIRNRRNQAVLGYLAEKHAVAALTALEHLDKELSGLDSVDMVHAERAHVLHTIGVIYSKEGNDLKAREAYQKAAKSFDMFVDREKNDSLLTRCVAENYLGLAQIIAKIEPDDPIVLDHFLAAASRFKTLAQTSEAPEELWELYATAQYEWGKAIEQRQPDDGPVAGQGATGYVDAIVSSLPTVLEKECFPVAITVAVDDAIRDVRAAPKMASRQEPVLLLTSSGHFSEAINGWDKADSVDAGTMSKRYLYAASRVTPKVELSPSFRDPLFSRLIPNLERLVVAARKENSPNLVCKIAYLKDFCADHSRLLQYGMNDLPRAREANRKAIQYSEEYLRLLRAGMAPPDDEKTLREGIPNVESHLERLQEIRKDLDGAVQASHD